MRDAGRRLYQMMRRLLNLLTVLSLLLCVASIALRARSYFVADRFERQRVSLPNEPTGSTSMMLLADDDHVGLYVNRIVAQEARWGRRGRGPESRPFHWVHTMYEPEGYPMVYPSDPLLVRLRFYAQIDWFPVEGFREIRLGAPIWFLTLLFAALPAARLYLHLRPKHPPGYCRRCGYDLRASPGRCPECGASDARLMAGDENWAGPHSPK